MGLKPVLFFIPIAIMLVAIAIESGVSATSGNGQLCANQQGQTSDCINAPTGTLFTLGGACPSQPSMNNAPPGSVYLTTCSNSLNVGTNGGETVNLWLSPVSGISRVVMTCPSACPAEIYPVTSVTFFSVNLGSPILATCQGGGTVLTFAATCTTTAPYTQNQPAAGSGLFSFIGSVGLDSNGWIILAITLVGVAVLASITIFGTSATNTEGTHILFLAGGMIVLWIILVAVEGFPGSNETFFNSMNSFIPAAGTAIFMLITLIYGAGIFTAVSRGV